MSDLIETVQTKEFTSVGVRLVIYKLKLLGGRIDLYELDDPSSSIFEGYYKHQLGAVAKFNSITNNKEAIDWAYQNS